MSESATAISHQAYVNRKQGEVSSLESTAGWPEAKPDFYADSRYLNDDILGTLQAYNAAYPPYGLVDSRGRPIESVHRWDALELAFVSTVMRAYDETKPSLATCPYHEILAARLGKRSVRPFDYDTAGLDTLRGVSLPGGVAAPALVVNILARFPAIHEQLGASVRLEALARASGASLLQRPLMHPQQHAKAFMFCLAPGNGGPMAVMSRQQFMDDAFIAENLKLMTTANDLQRVAWARPTADLLLKTAVSVPNRTLAPEYEDGDHVVWYPAGTRLGDIAVDEPTVGCPGKQVAYELWNRTIDVTIGENLWARSAA